MENFFTKKVQNVFAILKRSNKEEGGTTHHETKEIKSDEAGTDGKKKSPSPKLPTEKDPKKEPKRKLNNEPTTGSNKKETPSTEARDNDHSVIKKRKLIKLHNKDNVYLIDNFINIKKCSDANNASGRDAKKSGAALPPTDAAASAATSVIAPTTASRATLNTPNICNLLSIKKDEGDKKAKAQEARLINSNARSAGGLEQTLANHPPEQSETGNNPKKGKITSLVPTTNICTKEEGEEREKNSTEMKKNNQKEEQTDQALLKSMNDKKSETKKQKNSHFLSNSNNDSQRENSLVAKNSGGEKRVNRIDEMFKNLIEESRKKDKLLSNPDSGGNAPCQANHINHPDGGSALEENKNEQHLEDEPAKGVDEGNPNDNTAISSANGKIVTQETLLKDGEPGEEGEKGGSPTHGEKLQRDEPLQFNGGHATIGSAKTDSPAPSRSSSVGSAAGRSPHSCFGSRVGSHSGSRSSSPCKDTKPTGESQPEEHSPLCGDDKSTSEAEGATPGEPPCDTSEAEEADSLKIKFPQFAMDQSKSLINETNEFFKMYDLNLKVECLPIGISNDLKLLMEKKKKFVCIINDYKNELRQRRSHSRREEKNAKGRDPLGGQLQTVVEAASVGVLNLEKQANEATPGKCPPHEGDDDGDDGDDNNNTNNGVTRDDFENVNEPSVSPKMEGVKPEPPTMESKTPLNNCEMGTDQHDVESLPDGRNRSSVKDTANHEQDELNEEEVKKGSNHLEGRKKRKGEEKKLEKGGASYDNLNYLSDDDKEFVEREHRKFLTLLERVNRGGSQPGEEQQQGGGSQPGEEQQPGGESQPDEEQQQGGGSQPDGEQQLGGGSQPGEKQQPGESNHLEPAPQVEAAEAEVTKKQFIKHLMRSLTEDCSEEKNYAQQKEIKDEETKFEKMKETIRRIKIKEKKIDVLLSSSKSLFNYTNMYRRRQILHEKMLMNWSYVQSWVNKKNDVRNRNLPFQLLELDKELTKSVPKAYDDILLDHFSGIIITLNTTSFETAVDGNAIHLTKVVCGCLIEYLGTSEMNIKCIWAHPFLNAKSTYYILSAFLPRVILEAFLNCRTPSEKEAPPNELMDSSRFEEEHTEDGTPGEMTQSKKKKSFYDRLHQLRESDSNEGQKKKKKKEKKIDNDHTNEEEDAFFSNFAMQQYPPTYFLNFSKDCAEILQNVDGFSGEAERKSGEGSGQYSYPTWGGEEEDSLHGEDLPCVQHRQDSEPDGKNKSGANQADKFLHIIFSDIDIFPRQCYLLLCSYKYMCLNMHYDTDCYSVHHDLNLKNTQKGNVGKNTELSNLCPCTSVRNVSSDTEDSYERIIGCSELYMYYMIPKREERERLGLLERNGWRDLIPSTFDEDISENISSIVKTRTSISSLYEHISTQNKQNEKNYTTAYINKYEWCGLKIKDIRNMMNEDFNYESPKKK
ncbi:hypothetical protein PVIIG_03199 [Plasmodium vivax India VII]|uniref:Uncharacterized protein n=1 Tax=Plasmodium vivax India VII TaxID=1077284 RepID=A0A0J9SBI9_PLAVI|nr:hypothetical protein PVIIG_03199 [Plasmodium vivax India VII]